MPARHGNLPSNRLRCCIADLALLTWHCSAAAAGIPGGDGTAVGPVGMWADHVAPLSLTARLWCLLLLLLLHGVVAVAGGPAAAAGRHQYQLWSEGGCAGPCCQYHPAAEPVPGRSERWLEHPLRQVVLWCCTAWCSGAVLPGALVLYCLVLWCCTAWCSGAVLPGALVLYCLVLWSCTAWCSGAVLPGALVLYCHVLSLMTGVSVAADD
jgi:hypothetical protein